MPFELMIQRHSTWLNREKKKERRERVCIALFEIKFMYTFEQTRVTLVSFSLKKQKGKKKGKRWQDN